MPTTCEGCRFYYPADAPGPCPGCGGPLRFTLLPPLNADPAPLDLSPADAPPPIKRHERDAAADPSTPVRDFLLSTPVLAVFAVGVFVLLLARVWVVIARSQGDPAFAPR